MSALRDGRFRFGALGVCGRFTNSRARADILPQCLLLVWLTCVGVRASKIQDPMH